MARRALLVALAVSGCANRALELPMAPAPAGQAAPTAADLGAPTAADLAAPSPADLALPSPPDLALPSVADLANAGDLAYPIDFALPTGLRLLAPLSAATVTTHRPTLRWQSPAPGAPVVDLCRDRACTQPLASATVAAAGTSARPDAPLGRGVVFWRVRDGAAVTPTWEFFVGARDSTVDASGGTTFDYDGDGYADVAVAQSRIDAAGVAFVYRGGPGGIAVTPAAQLPQPAMDGLFNGKVVAGAGDLDGDGFGDLAIGTSTAGAPTGGVVRVYRGGPAGIGADAIELVVPDNTAEYAWFVLGAGDLDGDGYGDLVVSGWVPGADGPQHWFLYPGGPDGVNDARRRILELPRGSGGAAACDFNGDGYADLLIGQSASNGETSHAYVFYGGRDGLSTPQLLADPEPGQNAFAKQLTSGDLDGDGYCDAVVSYYDGKVAQVFAGGPAGVAATPSRRITWPTAGFGGAMLAVAGDVDGDGRDDLLLGDMFAAGLHPAGKLDLYLSGSGATTRLSSSDDWFGAELAGAGDVDGDGFADVVTSGVPADNIGRAYVYRGGPAGFNPPDGSVRTTLTGSAYGFGDSLAGWH
jgi:hypothetical protein